MIPRNITNHIIEALSYSPVVLLNGARQTGKSTLVQMLAKQLGYQYMTLDDFTVLEAITRDPSGFLSAIDVPLVLDEVQRVPQVFLSIKAEVDQNRKPGRFLLTGSANIFMLPKLSESLAGRIEILTLYPFSCDELEQYSRLFTDDIFAQKPPAFHDEKFSVNDLVVRTVSGGYPEVQKFSSARRRGAWFGSYITTILQRDVRDLSRIEGIHELPRLLSLIAAQSGSILNMASLSRDAGIPLMTLKRYLILLESTFLVTRLSAWFSNIGKRLTKAPKIYLNDTGLLSYLLGFDSPQFKHYPQRFGRIFENYIFHELLKQASWSRIQPKIYYFRTTSGIEVDFILENNRGEIVGIEVKSAATVRQKDFKGLAELSNLLGDRFIRGIILYTGKMTVPFAENLFAVPIRTLWLNPAE